ncbi:ArsR/SmtB family transcription factor [Luteolibacter luteus]|uniref:Winged helix-turn-helix transcriptional regulator n=1 Tax=Luteolibacter luteus TaxID=2728835 RepID=A0A858RDX9_9BACT|nr:metalloregulator ArsR/SmtB family transcription factor [Luteolibacter luteus]QJE94383.1 winged helix-turn-helix transcriptional regulator [Luteolibacter luteus]
MTDVVTFSKILSDETRWRILRLIKQEALCVCELADILEMPQSSVSSHVQVIRKAGLLESEKREKWTYFRIEARYLKPIAQLEAFFHEDNANHPWREDEDKMSKRLEERADSCCPGPIQLKPRRSRTITGPNRR